MSVRAAAAGALCYPTHTLMHPRPPVNRHPDTACPPFYRATVRCRGYVVNYLKEKGQFMEENKQNGGKAEPGYPLPPIGLLRLERAGAQEYTAAIDDNARVKWHGKRCVEVPGRRLWNIAPIKMELLRQCLEKYDFLNLDKKNPDDTMFYNIQGESDYASCTITVIFRDGSRKIIKHDINTDNMPKRLFQLESRIETILGTRKWAGRPPQPE